MKNPHYETPRMKRLLRYLVWKRVLETRKSAALRAMVDNVRMRAPDPYILFSHASDPTNWNPSPR